MCMFVRVCVLHEWTILFPFPNAVNTAIIDVFKTVKKNNY